MALQRNGLLLILMISLLSIELGAKETQAKTPSETQRVQRYRIQDIEPPKESWWRKAERFLSLSLSIGLVFILPGSHFSFRGNKTSFHRHTPSAAPQGSE